MKNLVRIFLFCQVLILSACIFSDRRGISTQFTDDRITSEINQKISELPDFHATHVIVKSYDQQVLLVGQVPTDATKQSIFSLATETPDVKKVHNELVVGPATGLSQHTQDAWINAHINTLLSASNSYGMMHIKVTTENGVVYLMGLVTREEGEGATEKARSVAGVKEVVRLFEYVE